MPKTFKEYLGGFRLGYYDNIEPMASLGDTPPKGQAGKDSRGVGLHANYTTQAPGTIRPFLTATDKNPADKDSKRLQKKNKQVKEDEDKELDDFLKDLANNTPNSQQFDEDINLQDVKNAAKRFAKGIYDKLKRIATTSKRYEYAAKVLQDVIDRKKKERAKEGLPLRHDIGYYSAAVADTFKDIDPKKLVKMVHENLNEMWTLEDLYSDDNPKDTVRGTGYGDASSARKTLKIITSVDKERQMQIVNTLYNRAKHHANQTAGMRDAMKIFKKWIDDNKIKETPLYNYLLDKGVIKQEK